ncbi:NS3 [Fall chinook aquareovirus]|uniref:NS3 n=1 Tax=Fall chinook aquareovirus TaxID=1963254 RepID=UPI0009949BCF|nr:NS3 [Fall chinook aquareovirus]AQU42736.1 NS3 [Fall chinook aquareovirus]
MAYKPIIDVTELAQQLINTKLFSSAKDVSSIRRELSRHAADPYSHEHTVGDSPPPTPYLNQVPSSSYRLCAVPVVSHSSGGHSATVSVPARVIVDVTAATLVLTFPSYDFHVHQPLVSGGKLFLSIDKGNWHDLSTGCFNLDAFNMLRDTATGKNSTTVSVKWYGGTGPSRGDLRSTGSRARIHVTDRRIMFELPGVDSAGTYPDLTVWGSFAVFE